MASKSKSGLMVKLGTKCMSLLRYSALSSVFCVVVPSLKAWVLCLLSSGFLSAFKGPFSLQYEDCKAGELFQILKQLDERAEHIFDLRKICIISPVQGWLLKYATVILMSVTTRDTVWSVTLSLQQSVHLLINIHDQDMGLNMVVLCSAKPTAA